MIRPILMGMLALSLCGPASAQSAPTGPALDRPDAFEHGFAVSLYQFDACGDPLAGRMFRRALAARFAQCPFSAEARSRFQRRTRFQQAKVWDTMQSMIDSHGGLPVKLDGMSMTCREQQADAGYKLLRGRLEQYSQGTLPAEAIITAACDAPEITPEIAR